MKVSDLMSTDVVTTTPDATLRDVARMLVEHKVSGIPVCDDAGTVVGVVSEGDILFRSRVRSRPVTAFSDGSSTRRPNPTSRKRGRAPPARR